MSCSKPSCSSGPTELNTDWCADTSTSCNTCVPEDSCQGHSGTSIIRNFDATLKVDNSWVIPNCGGSAILSISCLSNIMVGSFLWSAGYGYFRVVSYNSTTNKVTVTNDCTVQNQVPGTPVPAGTLFVVSDSPFPFQPSCTELTLPLSLVVGTSSYTITVGDSSIFSQFQTLQIGTRTDYLLLISSIPSSTQVNVTTYPAVAANEIVATGTTICVYIPCDNYEYKDAAYASTSSSLGTKTITRLDTVFTSNAQSITVTNNSACRPMTAMYTTVGTVFATATNGNAAPFVITYEILFSRDAGSYSAVTNFSRYFQTVADVAQPADQAITTTGSVINSNQISPTSSTVLNFKLRCTFAIVGGTTSSYSITGCSLKIAAVGVNEDNS